MQLIPNPELRADVELLVGFDNNILAYLRWNGSYVRLGKGSAAIAEVLDGTRTELEIAEHIKKNISMQPINTDMLADYVRSVISSFDALGMLVSSCEQNIKKKRISITPIKKFPVLKKKLLEKLTNPAAKAMSQIRPSDEIFLFLQISLILTGFSLGVFSLLRYPKELELQNIIAGFVVYLMITILHELGHAVVSHYYGYQARTLGLAFWYYIIPVAYTDCTDSYRIASRISRININLAGPAVDMIFSSIMSCYILLFLDNDSYILSYVLGVLFFLSIGLIGNFNPLLPTDGQKVIENVTGIINLRNQSIKYAVNLFFPLKENVTNNSKPVPIFHLIYGLLCMIYLFFLLSFIVVVPIQGFIMWRR